MSSELFLEYQGVNPRDGIVAAAKVERENVKKLSAITGGIANAKMIKGGSLVYDGLILNGEMAKIGDYVIALEYNTYSAYPKEFFETRYTLKGTIRI